VPLTSKDMLFSNFYEANLHTV